MEDSELLESVYELVLIADAGIADAVGKLATDIDNGAIEAALDACLGNVETIATAVEMAQLDDLRQVCAAVDTHLRSLNGDAGRYLREYGPRLVNWGGAVLMYLRQPDAPELAENLLGPLPDGLRAELLAGLGLTIPEPASMELDDDTALARESTAETTSEPDMPELEISFSAETAPVDQFVDSVAETATDEAEKAVASGLAEVALAEEPAPELAVEPIVVGAAPVIGNDSVEAGGDRAGLDARRSTVEPFIGPTATVTEDTAALPILADAVVESDVEPAPQLWEAEAGGGNPVGPICEDAIEVIDPTPDAPVNWDETDTGVSEIVRQLAEPFAELSAWLDILTAPVGDKIELARATASSAPPPATPVSSSACRQRARRLACRAWARFARRSPGTSRR